MATATAPDPTTAAAPPMPPGEPADRLFRITLDLYNRMGELGLLGPRDRIELLDGFLVKKMPKGPRHVTSVHRIFKIMLVRLPAGWHPRFEAPIELPRGPDGDSSPEPDIVIVKGTDADFNHRHPRPEDVRLVIQVADSSLAVDRKALRRFAWAGIPAAWIVNLRNGTVEIYTGPSGPVDDPGYAQKSTKGAEDALDFGLDDAPVAGLRVADFLA